WFRARDGLVRVTAQPLDGRPGRFTGSVGTPSEYGPTGFAPSILEFSRQGCWRVQARLAGRVLEIIASVPGPAAGPLSSGPALARSHRRIRRDIRLVGHGSDGNCDPVSVPPGPAALG